MKSEDGILITGIARSGTSATAGSIDICGAYGGKTAGGTRYNQKGFFENTEIRNALIKPFLLANNCDPLGQNPLPDIEKLDDFPELQEKFFQVMQRHGYKQGKWYYKGAKMCLIWTVIHNAFPNAKWVIVRRNDEDIINSCLKTGFMRKNKGREGWQWWIDEHKKRFQEMHTAGLQIKEIYPAKMAEGDFTEMQECIEWLGLEWKEKEVRKFIDPQLYSRTKVK